MFTGPGCAVKQHARLGTRLRSRLRRIARRRTRYAAIGKHQYSRVTAAQMAGRSTDTARDFSD